MGTSLGVAKVKIFKSGRRIHIQNFLKYPSGYSTSLARLKLEEGHDRFQWRSQHKGKEG